MHYYAASFLLINDKIICVPEIGCKTNFFIIKKKGSQDSGDESGHDDFLEALLDKSNSTESSNPPVHHPTQKVTARTTEWEEGSGVTGSLSHQEPYSELTEQPLVVLVVVLVVEVGVVQGVVGGGQTQLPPPVQLVLPLLRMELRFFQQAAQEG